MKSVLGEIAGIVKAELGNRSDMPLVVDIGSNDGTLLRAFGPEFHRIGFEPSNLAEKSGDAGEIINDFFSLTAWNGHLGDVRKWKVDAVTSIAMFYDLENPSKFCEDIASILKRDGVWVDQQNYLGSMIQNNGFDNIVHEHLGYYSLTSLSEVVESAGLQIYRVETNDVNGGSLRTFISHRDTKIVENSVSRQLDWEKSMKLNTRECYEAFYARIMTLRSRTLGYIGRQVRAGKKIYVLGAGTRGNTILQWYGLDEQSIAGAVDKNPDKWGRRIVGTDIPIMKRDDAMPDFFLVLPHHFLREFEEQEKLWLSKGGRFIVPLPDLKVPIELTGRRMQSGLPKTSS